MTEEIFGEAFAAGAVVGGDGFFAAVVDVEAGMFPREKVGQWRQLPPERILNLGRWMPRMGKRRVTLCNTFGPHFGPFSCILAHFRLRGPGDFVRIKKRHKPLDFKALRLVVPA
jgi:hypothetical protein